MATVLRHEQQEEASTSSREYLCYFLHRYGEFRRPEVEALAGMAGCSTSQLTWRMAAGDKEFSPFWHLRVPTEEVVKNVTKRVLLTRAFIEVWGEGSSWAEVQAAVEAFPAERKAPWLGEDVSFKFIVDTFGVSMSMEQQMDAINRVRFVPLQGQVKLKNPDQRFWILFCDCNNNALIPEPVPYRIYFGREVGAGDRALLDHYTLRRRHYLGPTSMDSELALIMCSMAQVRKGHLVMDPYAGTGSILVAAAHFGAYVLGTDIDARVIKEGKVGKKGEALTVHSNFEQYGFPLPLALIRMDMHKHAFRHDLVEILDAVVCDPPYGVRAGGKKSAPRPGLVIRDRATHIPATEPYTLGECLRDLLELSARLLKVGGRLVYWLPATPETYLEEDIPAHPALRLLHNSEQMLTTRYSRRLLTLEKVAPYDAAAAAAHYAARPDPTMPIDRIHDIVYENLRDEKGDYGPDKNRKRNPCRGKMF